MITATIRAIFTRGTYRQCDRCARTCFVHRLALCAGCLEHVGWLYQSDDEDAVFEAHYIVDRAARAA